MQSLQNCLAPIPTNLAFPKSQTLPGSNETNRVVWHCCVRLYIPKINFHIPKLEEKYEYYSLKYRSISILL